MGKKVVNKGFKYEFEVLNSKFEKCVYRSLELYLYNYIMDNFMKIYFFFFYSCELSWILNLLYCFENEYIWFVMRINKYFKEKLVRVKTYVKYFI